MSNPTIRLKLISGSDELDIHDWSDYVVLANGFTDAGSTIELRWQTPLQSCAGGAGKLQRLVGELRKYIQRARQYEQENIGNPVYLAVYWPECEDIPVPCFGRGWRYKRITDGALAEGTPSLGQGQPDMRFGSDVIPVLAAMFTVKQDPDGEYAWQSEFHWTAEGKGHIEPVAENGIRMWEASQNLLINGDMEDGTTGHGWTENNVEVWTRALRAKYGQYCMQVEPTAIAGDAWIAFTGVAGTEYTASAWFYVPCGTLCSLWQLQLWDDVTGNIVTAAPTLHNTWERVVVTGTTAGGAAAFRVKIATTSVFASEFIYIDGVQVEQNAYATPFIQPDRHLGETWDTCDDHFNSNSSRATGEFRIVGPAERLYATPCCGSIHFWWQPEFDSTDITGAGEASLWDWYKDGNEYIWVYYDYGTQTIEMWINAAMVVTSVAQVFSSGDFIGIGASWDFGNDVYKLYVDGALVDEDATAMTCPDLRGYDIFIGSEYNATDPMNGAMYDLRHWNEVLVDAHMGAVYGAGRGNGELPYVWSEKGPQFWDHGALPQIRCSYGVELENHDDGTSGDTNYVEIGNVPGDIDGKGFFHALVEALPTEGPLPTTTMIYYGVRRIEASHIRDSGCGQFIWEAEDSVVAPWTLQNADAANTSGGQYTQRLNVPVAYDANYQEFSLSSDTNIQWLRGQWRVFVRMRTNDANNVWVRLGDEQLSAAATYVISWLPDEIGLQMEEDSGMGIGDLWELHDFGVITLPPVLLTEQSLLNEDRSYNNWGGQGYHLFLEVMGTAGTEDIEVDYVMLVPEEMSGVWKAQAIEIVEPPWDFSITNKGVMTDTYSPHASGAHGFNKFLYMQGAEIGDLLDYRGNPVWFLTNGSSRVVLATTEWRGALNWETKYSHVIDRAMYASAKIAPRYYRSR